MEVIGRISNVSILQSNFANSLSVLSFENTKQGHVWQDTKKESGQRRDEAFRGQDEDQNKKVSTGASA